MLAEARATLGHVDAELSDVDARINSSPGLRNAAIYGTYAVLFAVMQLPMLASLAASRNALAIVGAPCGLALVLVSFCLGWLTIGFLYQQPGGQRPPRTPLIGAVVSLLAIAPGLFTLAWAAASAITR
jgi:Na+/proline symporter